MNDKSLLMMMLFLAGMLLNIAVYIKCDYIATNSDLIKVPSDISSSETIVNLNFNAISRMDG